MDPFRQCEAVPELLHLPLRHAVPGEMFSPACGRFPHLFPDSRRLAFAESEGPDVTQDIGKIWGQILNLEQ